MKTNPSPPLAAGRSAPAFRLVDQHGRNVALRDFRGRSLLVYFYPRAMTSGCTAQACAVRDALGRLESLQTAAVGISPDLPERQAAFAQAYDLTFPLLSDPDHAAAAAWGVWKQKSLYGRKYWGVVRSAFLVDARGKITHAWPRITPANTIPAALGALAAGVNSAPGRRRPTD